MVPLDEVCTKFTTQRFFPDAFTRLNMISNVLRLYEALAAAEREVERGASDRRASEPPSSPSFDVVFKGGVMMRLLILETLHDLDVGVRDEALAYLASAQGAVGLSDFDFETVPTSRAPKEGATWQQVIVTSVALLWLRRYLQRYVESERSFEAERETLLSTTWDPGEAEHALREELRDQVRTLPATHPLHGASVDHVHVVHPRRAPPPMQGYRTRAGRSFPAKRQNLTVFHCEQGACVTETADALEAAGFGPGIVALARETGGALYVTTNMHIGEGEEKAHARAHAVNFHLSRIKQAFVLYYTTKAGERRIDRLAGEVVDLSQSHGPAHDETRRTLYADVAEPWATYQVVGLRDVSLRSYSLSGLLHDMHEVVHHGSTPPWENAKIGKRAVRYAFLLGMLALRDAASADAALRSLDAFARYVGGADTAAADAATGVAGVDASADAEHASVRAHRVKPLRHTTLRAHVAEFARLVRLHAARRAMAHNPFATTPINAMHVEHDDE